MPLSRERLRLESICSGIAESGESFAGVRFRRFVSADCGATGFYTGIALLAPGSSIPWHIHAFSEAATVLLGEPLAQFGTRQYRLKQYDCFHVPASVPHTLMNDSKDDVLVHTAFASSAPDRQFIERILCTEDLGHDASPDGSPESVIRFEKAEVYELAPRAYFRDLFGGRFGARGICGGYGLFEPGASLPCHFHEYDESITIVEGEATCLVEGKRYTLSGFDTAYVPKGRRHRFLNQTDRPMAMLWVYAGSDPERTIVDAGYCSGELIAE